MTIFERIIDDADVEVAVTTVLERWLPTYISEVERQKGLEEGYYARPASYRTRNDMEKWPEEELPSVIVIAPGVADRPTKDGNKSYRVPWNVGVAVVCSAMDHLETRRMSYRYAAAVRAALVQHQSLDRALDGTVRGVDWVDGRNNELPPEDDRTIFASRQLFIVEVDNVVSGNAGPTSPDPMLDPQEPYADWPTVPDRDHLDVTITKESN